MNRPLWLLILLMMTCLAPAGCDRPKPGGGGAKSTPLATHAIAEFKTIAQLPPSRAVHVAVDTLGNVLETVETDNARDGVMVIGESGIPRGTRLNYGNILAAMGETVGGSGTIQDLAAGPNGIVWFYFVGGKGRTLRACIGQFSLRDELIRVVYDTDRLKRVSGMGDSLELARATLLPMGNRTFLLLRHTDKWVILSFDSEKSAPARELELTQPFTSVTGNDIQLDLTRPQYELAPGTDGKLLLVDRSIGEMMDLDLSGKATPRLFLAGLPRETSLPLVMPDGKLLIFAADSEPMQNDPTDIVMRRLPRVAFPALIRVEGKALDPIPRDDLRVPGGFPGYAMRFHQIEPAPDGSFVAYDQSSGQLMRIRIVQEAF